MTHPRRSGAFHPLGKTLGKHWKVFIPLVVFSFVYFIQHPNRLTDPWIRYDERANLNVALNIPAYSATDGPYDPVLPYPTGPDGFWSHPPLYYILISPIAFSPYLCRLLSLSIAYLNLLLTYVLAEKRVANSGFIACTILALIPSMIVRGDVITMDMLWLMFILLTLVCFEYKIYRIALACCALGVNVKYPYLLAALPLIPVRGRRFISFLVVALAALLPFGVWSYLRAGDFLMLNTWLSKSAPFYTYYLSPGIHLISLILIVTVGFFRKKLLIKKELPFLFLIIGNLLQFYATPLRRLYYLLPSYAVVSILAGNYLYIEAKTVVDKVSRHYAGRR